VWHGAADPWADYCGAAPCVRACGLAGSGQAHKMARILCDHHNMWAGECRKAPWVLGLTVRCSVKCPKGAAARDGLAGGEVRLRLDNMYHDEVHGVLPGR
jgi:hypothetical protein